MATHNPFADSSQPLDGQSTPAWAQDAPTPAMPPPQQQSAMMQPDSPAPQQPTWAQEPLPPGQQQFVNQALYAGAMQAKPQFSEYDVPDEDEKSVPSKLVIALRASHVVAAFMLVLAAVLKTINVGSASTLFVCAYTIFFGCVVCLYEVRLKALVQLLQGNCGFILHTTGRTAFLVLVGTLACTLGTIGIIAASVTFLSAGINVYVGVSYYSCCNSESSTKEIPQSYMPVDTAAAGPGSANPHAAPGAPVNPYAGGVDV